ncbi:MAG: hypothetical protein IPF73_11420 [Betaproteobacteria bacterium]|nr:hypothetical protein [Betaproteobacteria bacterium]
MLRRLAIALFATALAFALPARAADPDYSDIWWAAGGVESGWGVNFAQSPGVIFVTFFIYGPDKQPVWYVASMVQTGAGRYSGALYRVTGSWFGGAWLPTDATETMVGEAQFVAENVVRGVFTYRVDTTQVVKTIERQSLTAIDLAGTYLGGVLIKSSAGCSSGASSKPFAYQYIVTHEAEFARPDRADHHRRLHRLRDGGNGRAVRPRAPDRRRDLRLRGLRRRHRRS